MTKINIMALRHSAFYTPLLLTMCGGFLKEQGLEHHYTLATPDNTVADALRQGDAHLSQFAPAASFAELEQGEGGDLVHFAQINARDGFFIAGRQPSANFDWHNLQGREVLVDHLFQPLAMLRYALDKLGIDFDSIKVIDAGDVESMDRAFRNGQGDYIHQQGPAPQQLEHDGIAYTQASVGELIGPVAFSSLCATRDWLDTDMACAFMAAYRKAQHMALEAPAHEIARMEQEFFPNIDQQVLGDTIATYQQLGCWQDDPVISRESYENLLDIFLFDGLITRRHAYESVVVAPPCSSAAGFS